MAFRTGPTLPVRSRMRACCVFQGMLPLTIRQIDRLRIVQQLYELVLVGEARNVDLVSQSELLFQAQFICLHSSHTEIELVSHFSQFVTSRHQA